MKTAVFAVVGEKKSGKTTVIEILVKELAKKGYRVCVVKHIPEPNFSIDKEGKDTWKFARAGAKKIVSVAADEVATIEKICLKGQSLEDILKRCMDSDIVFVEGFRRFVGKDLGIQKLVVVRSSENISEAMEAFKPILAFVGLDPISVKVSGAPYVNILKNPGKLLDLVEGSTGKSVAE